MQLDKELTKEVRIPTTGMEPFNIIRYQDRMLSRILSSRLDTCVYSSCIFFL